MGSPTWSKIEEILAIVGSEPAAQAVGKLVDLANARGGHDNITVIVVRARERALANPTLVAQTVAQTNVFPMVPGGATAVDGASETPTLLEPPPQALATAPLAPTSPPGTSRPLEPTVPPSSGLGQALRRRHPAAIMVLALAFAAVAVLAAMLVEEVTERSGKRNPTTTPTPSELTGSDAAPSAGRITTLAPEPIVVPAAPTPVEPIAPLEPPAKRPFPKGRHSGTQAAPMAPSVPNPTLPAVGSDSAP